MKKYELKLWLGKLADESFTLQDLTRLNEFYQKLKIDDMDDITDEKLYELLRISMATKTNDLALNKKLQALVKQICDDNDLKVKYIIKLRNKNMLTFEYFKWLQGQHPDNLAEIVANSKNILKKSLLFLIEFLISILYWYN